jgi:hypothetical protein
MSGRPYVFAAALVTLVGAAAQVADAKEHIVRVSWDADGSYRTELRLEPRKFKEACVELARGEAVQWTFQADSESAFNIHFHEGEKVTYPAKKEGTREEAGVLQVQVSQVYCWMWRASEQPAHVTVSLRKAVR